MTTKRPSDEGGGGSPESRSPDSRGPDSRGPDSRGPESARGLGALERLPKERAASHIVEQLGALIVRGELKEGEPLPSERILAERFGVARGTVRQAIHKLNDWGLLHSRQGGITRIGDVNAAEAVEVIELRYRLGPVDARERREWIERRMLQGVSMIALAELNIDVALCDSELTPLVASLEGIEDAREAWKIELEFWRAIVKMGKNRLFFRELEWWTRITSTRADAAPSLMTASVRFSFYRELLRRLRENDGAARFYLEMTQLMLRSTASQGT